ncbi:Endothelin-converting enzyme 1 [Lamellibrachia satsuma]|nr:Endothelin-converting enzyme 1 [Lamellibrachia satsuma]
MLWRLVQDLVSHLSTPFREAEQKYKAAEKGTKRSVARWQYCMKAVDEWFGMTVGAMFVKEHFPRDSRADVEQMIENIRKTFLETLEAMGYQIGYPPFITNMTKVDVFYKWFSVDANDRYFDINLKCIGGALRKMANELLGRGDKNGWDMNPHEVNAYYAPVTNQMVFPAGILQKPYYTKNVPIYINYGGIGATIGHELTHGFDNYGAQYDKNGNLNNWWSKLSWANFKHRTSCMVDYYSNYTIHDIKVNGQLTLGENIADVGGVIQAYEAYKRAEKSVPQLQMPALGLTNDQVFFLSYGQNWCSKRRPENMKEYLVRNVHSPAAVRARGTLSLVKQFAEAFGCPDDSAMNPPERCEVW